MGKGNAKKAVVLLSGGLDSATTAAIARAEGFELYALTLDYGQRHSREIESAKAVAASLGVKEHIVLRLDLRKIARSALTGGSDVPLDRTESEMSSEIPPTYVPARNTVLLSLALAYAETVGAEDIFIGVSQIDYSGYPDCRSEFIEAFERLANLAAKAAVEGTAEYRIRAPLINSGKADAIRRGIELGLDYSLTWSCYLGGEKACGRCDSCRLRLAAFARAGVQDPLEYR